MPEVFRYESLNRWLALVFFGLALGFAEIAGLVRFDAILTTTTEEGEVREVTRGLRKLGRPVHRFKTA